MAELDRLMEVVDEVINAYSQIWTAQSNGATWEELMDDRKHYACKQSALKDMLQTLLDDRTRLEYEATMVLTAMTDAGARMRNALGEIRQQKTPCGECHLRPGERCDVCGALQGT